MTAWNQVPEVASCGCPTRGVQAGRHEPGCLAAHTTTVRGDGGAFRWDCSCGYGGGGYHRQVDVLEAASGHREAQRLTSSN